MRRKRVLIVDDSVVVRRLLSDIVLSDPALEVAATAAHGRIALSKIPQVQPDIVTLDLEMPEMNGLETLVEIRKLYPTLPVIVFSAQTERGGKATLDALALGANDYVTKPTTMNGDAGIRAIHSELVEKIKVFCSHARCGEIFPSAPAPVEAGFKSLPFKKKRVEVLAIGVSTGGPNALAAVIPQLPGNFPVPILIVQHMPPVFTRLLAERLAAASLIKVSEASNGDLLMPGHAYIAPGDFHMSVENSPVGKRICIHQSPPENSCRPAADVLFRSVAEHYGPCAMAVVMTGMGQDGLLGCECIHDAGGLILAQDEASSVVWGMPGFVARAGLAEAVVALDQMAAAITQRVRQGRGKPAEAGFAIG